MGGMGMGGMNARGGSQTPNAISVVPAARPEISAGGDADLLGGLKSANAANQNAKVMHLKQRQDAGAAACVGGGMF